MENIKLFISSVEITNFRTFKEKQIIRFTEGINILVGPNNIGKTTIISAIRLIFDKNKFGLDINDFSKIETKEELKNCVDTFFSVVITLVYLS